MSKLNAVKIQNAWRKILRIAKVGAGPGRVRRQCTPIILASLFPQIESLRKDVEVISQNHERDVDRKDALIQMLDRDVEEAEDQYQIALRQHLRGVDRLVDLQVRGRRV